MDAFATNGTK